MSTPVCPSCAAFCLWMPEVGRQRRRLDEVHQEIRKRIVALGGFLDEDMDEYEKQVGRVMEKSKGRSAKALETVDKVVQEHHDEMEKCRVEVVQRVRGARRDFQGSVQE
eukprot:2707951-Karenia_brevis.AAC.1